MTRPPINSSISKGKALICLEYALLTLCLGVIALRTIFTEGPAMQSTPLPNNLGDSLYSLSVSACLLGAFMLWFVWNICGKNIFYRPTGIEIGLVLFCVAAAISCFAASDKRVAITSVIVSISPLLCAVLLIQILDSPAKVNLVLAVIAALGVLGAYQCFEQLYAGNEVMIEQYEENPQSMLEPLGIEPDTLKHFLFEHRLYASNVHAFFTTRNSAGSFLLLSFFAALALYLHKLKNRKSEQSKFRDYAACIIPIAVILAAMVLTKSKGAIIGLIFAAALLVTYLRFGTIIKAHRKIIFVACVLSVIAGGIAIAWYGLKYDRLPGGNSMLVRWQYWHASAKMYADHSLTGVGPGNFASFYCHYKPAAALESVSDPHNFPLSILTQYGPLGLVALLAMIFVPLLKVIFPKSSVSLDGAQEPPSSFKAQAITFILFLWLFLIPALIVFIVSFLLLRVPTGADERAKRKIHSFTAAVLFCAVLGVALHNLTDFAFFEPGVYTTFWVLMACLVATDSFTQARRRLVLKPAAVIKIVTLVAALGVCFVFINYALVPVASGTAKIEKANHYISLGRFERAHSLLDAAAVTDGLSPVASSLNARLYLYLYRQSPDKNRELLIRAQECLKTAIERNSANFKNHERLAEVYLLLSEISAGQEQADWLNKAFSAASDSVRLYPGCGRIHLTLAEVAEKLDRDDIALENYKKTIDIEEQYRRQFKAMYPQREKIVSRLGEKKYQLALDRVKELSITKPPSELGG